mmetsp:Transcript_16455/g.53748  ORF Transcript_16455/g.53748 Transcript_16455/m.53748 type:complete len:622 (+) Transcript_16455:64-1929(+)
MQAGQLRTTTQRSALSSRRVPAPARARPARSAPAPARASGSEENGEPDELTKMRRKTERFLRVLLQLPVEGAAKAGGATLEERIASGEFTTSSVGSFRAKLLKPLRKALAQRGARGGSLALAKASLEWEREARRKLPEATGDIREIVGECVFIPLYNLFLAYGDMFRLSFGPKSFVVVSSPKVAKDILATHSDKFSKGILAEILDFVMGQGLIPADGEVWRTRRRALVPSIHKRYIESMVGMFGDSAEKGAGTLAAAAAKGEPVEMENFFSRLTLDIIGKAVFNYEFDSLRNDDPVIKAVYTVLREAEYRSVAVFPYWKVELLRQIVPRQRRCTEALVVINDTLDELIAECKRMVEAEDEEFYEEYLNEADPSILHFLIASGDEVSSKQLRDDLMTLLIAGHETTAAVLTWTFHLLHQHPEVMAKLQAEADEVLGDRTPTLADLKALRYTTRVINESMRLYPQPPVLIRRALETVTLGGYEIKENDDIFISVWNLHRSPKLWDEPTRFDPERFGPLDNPPPNETNQEYKYLPFGGGKRKCIGDQFAVFEATITLAMLMRRFDFALNKDAPNVKMETGATIHTSEGLLLDVSPRAFAPPTTATSADAVAAVETVDATVPARR